MTQERGREKTGNRGVCIVGQLRYVRQLLKGKLRNIRTAAFLTVQVTALFLYLKPLRRFSAAAGYPCAPWLFPFLISDLYFLFLFLLGNIYYFSDVPFMQYQNMYQVIRTGRKRWAAGQVAAICIQSFLIVFVEMAASVLLMSGHLEWTDGWGKLLHTAAIKGIPSEYRPLFGMSYDAMQLFTPVGFMALTLLLCTLVLCLIGLLMFAVSLYVGRIAAVAVATAMTVMIFFVEDVHPMRTRQVALFVPASWMRVTHLETKTFGYFRMPPLSYILTFLIIGIILLGFLIIRRIDRVEFEWTKED